MSLDANEQAVMEGLRLYHMVARDGGLAPGPIEIHGWCLDAAMRDGRDLVVSLDVAAVSRALLRLEAMGLVTAVVGQAAKGWRIAPCDLVNGGPSA